MNMSTNAVTVRYLVYKEGNADLSYLLEGSLNQYHEQLGMMKGDLTLSENNYCYVTNVPVKTGDVVLVKSKSGIKAAVVHSHFAHGKTPRPWRTVIAKVEFGEVLAHQRRERRKEEIMARLTGLIADSMGKEEVIREADRIYSYSLEVKDLLDEYKGL